MVRKRPCLLAEIALFFFVWILSGSISSSASLSTSSLGINYGMVANNLPSPAAVAKLLQSMSVSKCKIYNANPSVLQSFANTGISFIVGVGNEDVAGLTNLANATTWVKQNIANYLPNTKISGIAVGNEVFTGNDSQLMSQVLPAMLNMQTALVNLGLDGKIVISTPHSLAVLSNSYPPSAGAFRADLATTYIKPLLDFLSRTGSPFMVNAYPYFAYKSNPQSISLQYVLFQPNAGVTDPNNGLQYLNMLDAQLDAVYSALEAMGYQNLELMVSETGWPSAGDPDEAGATLQNAQTYNTNLIQRLASNKGTPLRPNLAVEAYMFALFNENLKPGPASERHYGLLNPDGTRVYDVGLDKPVASTTLYMASSTSVSLQVAPFWTGCVLCQLVVLLQTVVLL